MPILEVKGLVKYYRRRGKVVDGVCFEVEPGEVVGLLGPNGAGKTTSFRMATGQLTPDAGTVLFNDEDVTPLPMYRRARLGMGYLSQETSVFRKLTVEQNILAILEAMPSNRILGRKLTRRERWDRTDQVLEQFGLQRVRKNIAARLSGGEKRRLEIARCLVCDPLLILLDEPFTGIDPPTITDIRHIIQDLRKQNIGILVTDHQAREILKVTDRIYVIKDGKVVTHGTPQQIVQDPVAISEYLGTGFDEGLFGVPGAQALAKPSETVVSEVVEQEKIHRLIEALKTAEAPAAARELVLRGQAALPALFEALERRDVELRRQVFELIQQILGRPVSFDPYAPESLRRHQIMLLRENLERKAG
ncbi:MAG: LPS export ABC transporter ATP-binding protein [Planctomycetes bacterium]|nr:LPS export ABC transporter ATP-binding protein [Planctomycetota bacterium]